MRTNIAISVFLKLCFCAKKTVKRAMYELALCILVLPAVCVPYIASYFYSWHTQRLDTGYIGHNVEDTNIQLPLKAFFLYPIPWAHTYLAGMRGFGEDLCPSWSDS